MRRVAFLVYEGFQILDVTGPAAALEIAGHFGADYDICLVSVAGGNVRSSSGIAVLTEPIGEAAECDVLFVPGADRAWRANPDEALLRALQEGARAQRRVASVCSGAFILAAAGLLSGRRAATHWAATGELKRLYPDVQVDPDSIFVEDRGVWTSAGVAAGIDLALGMIGRDHGDETARKVAQKMVVYHRRPGTQSQHSELLELVTPDERFAPLLAWARANLDQPLSVEQLADRSALSVRQFTRAFTHSVGLPPAKAIERLRIGEARALIELGSCSREEAARRSGFGNAERMRRAFVKTTGQPPQAVRRSAKRYQAQDAPAG